MTTDIPDSHRDLLELPAATLATIGSDGRPQLSEVWFLADEGDRTEYGVYFNGQPGLWHALDALYPLQDPNRWDRLRQAVIADLETQNWTRTAPPRGSAFELHDPI